MINADRFLPVDTGLIPTGEMKSVKGSFLDFTTPQSIGARIGEGAGAEFAGGYDHCYSLNREGDGLVLAARVKEPASGRVMEIHTTEPGLQFYAGNFLDGKLTGPSGKAYAKHHGFCLEAQHYPDSPNKPQFPSTILKPGETYTQTTVHAFSVE